MLEEDSPHLMFGIAFAVTNCVDADAVYTAAGVTKVSDFGTCTVKCDSNGDFSHVSCSVLPWPKRFPCGSPLPEGWPANDFCSR